MPGLPIDAGFDVLSYDVTLRPDFALRAVAGREVVRVRSLRDGLQALDFTGNSLTVEGGRQADGRQAGGRLVVQLPRPLRKGETYTLKLRFSGRPARGLVWGERSVHSDYFTCDWMVCDQDRPGDTARFRLSLELPKGARRVTAGAGDRRAGAEYAPFLFGFAAGELTQTRLPNPGGPELVVLADSADVTDRLVSTPQIMAFLRDRAGLPLPFARYTQVLTADSQAQEAAGLALIGRPEIDPILEAPQEDWVIAHEMAHQWWGVLLSCEDLSQFWLNEGLATFMTAAWKEHRWGRAAYDRELDLARHRWAKARDQGVDRPLAFAGDYPSLGARRAIVYSKATLFLDALRQELGEAVFWDGLRRYTRDNVGRRVTSRDFQRAMEQAAGRNLQLLFETWVYGA